MNMTVQQPSLSSMLSQVATIVKVGKTSLGLKRQDKRASKESDRNHNAEDGAGSLSVNRFKGRGAERVDEINKVGNELIEMVKERTTDWGGQRLANNTVLQEILGIVQQKKATYQQLVDALVADAPALIAEAYQKIGTYDVQPPTEAEIRESFSITFEVSQIADSDTFRASNLEPALEAEMRRRLEASVQAAYTNATQDALKRVAEPVGKLIERMTDYSKKEDEKSRGVTTSGGRLYETTITNVTDIGKVFRSFNLTNDPLMTKIADQLDAFNNIGIDDLKGSQAMRDDVSQKAAAILDSLKDLI